MRLLRRRGRDTVLLDLVEEAGRNVQRASLLLRDLIVDYPEHAELARELYLCEQQGDRITHDIIHRLNGGNGTRPPRAPFDAADGHALASALDDIVDDAEQTADWLGPYGVEAPMEQSVATAGVLVGRGPRCGWAPPSRSPTPCGRCAPAPTWRPTSSRSTASRTRATASCATRS